MTVDELLEFIEGSKNNGLLSGNDLVHIGTKKYQTHALSASNHCHELVIREFNYEED